mmetsp:Transcript_27630/g.20045  ORF Transcript_27630/g.20045 Transcript_27630/m.20045 type:complete len:148 (+) Transcript_27630:2261-2704(+)
MAIIVAGGTLSKIEANPDFTERFVNIAEKVEIVLACRVSPKQKANIVEMIKKRHPRKVTLSIGDGANDVAMINEAHIGVGIAGKEGMQAARSSDFAISQFSFLKPLLFIHGRECYRRNAFMVCYIFYKNILYVTVEYFFGFASSFSG